MTETDPLLAAVEAREKALRDVIALISDTAEKAMDIAVVVATSSDIELTTEQTARIAGHRAGLEAAVGILRAYALMNDIQIEETR